MGSFLVGVVVVLGVVGIWCLVTFNKFVRLRNLVTESWKQIDVQLQRRHDLIPNLVGTVKGYAAHERETLHIVVKARTLAIQAHGPVKISETENDLTKALERLFVVAEAYPELKASQNFLQLQRELSDTEDRIAAARRIYNSNVRLYNVRQESLPSNVVATRMGLVLAEYYEGAGE